MVPVGMLLERNSAPLGLGSDTLRHNPHALPDVRDSGSVPSVGPFAGIDRGLRTCGHISDNPAELSVQQVVRGGWISDE